VRNVASEYLVSFLVRLETFLSLGGTGFDERLESFEVIFVVRVVRVVEAVSSQDGLLSIARLVNSKNNSLFLSTRLVPHPASLGDFVHLGTREGQSCEEDFGVLLVGGENEGNDTSHSGSGTSASEEELGVILFVADLYLSIGSDHLDLENVVDSQTMLSTQESVTSGKSRSDYSLESVIARNGSKTLLHSNAVNLGPDGSSTDPKSLSRLAPPVIDDFDVAEVFVHVDKNSLGAVTTDPVTTSDDSSTFLTILLTRETNSETYILSVLGTNDQAGSTGSFDSSFGPETVKSIFVFSVVLLRVDFSFEGLAEFFFVDGVGHD
jgi:hypothetical protein